MSTPEDNIYGEKGVLLYAKPEGLRYSYSIYPQENGDQIELSIIDEIDVAFNEAESPYPTLELAIADAKTHYENNVGKFIIKQQWRLKSVWLT